MAAKLLPGNALLQLTSLCVYKIADIWSLAMTLFCMLHPDLGSLFLTELSETGFDVHRNIGESLSEIILKNKRPKSSTKYQNTLINHWLNIWFALSQCLKINPCEGSSVDDILRALTKVRHQFWNALMQRQQQATLLRFRVTKVQIHARSFH